MSEEIINYEAENLIELKENFYNSIEKIDADYLKEKESKIQEISNNAFTQIGKELKEVQDRYSKNGYGTFDKWIDILSFKKTTVFNLIKRYEMIVQNLNEQNLIESLPLSLSYAISKPSAPAELVEKVLEGDITTNKEYQEQLKRIKEIEAENIRLKELKDDAEAIQYDLAWKLDQAQFRLDDLEDEKNEILKEKLIEHEKIDDLEFELLTIKNNPPRPEIKEVEKLVEKIVPDLNLKRELEQKKLTEKNLLESIKQLDIENRKLANYKDKIDEYNKAEALLHEYRQQLTGIKFEIEDTTKWINLNREIKEFINNKLMPQLTTMHLPKINPAVQSDAQLISTTIDNFHFAYKQKFQL